MKANLHYYRPAQFMDEREYTQRMVGAILTSITVTSIVCTAVFGVCLIVF